MQPGPASSPSVLPGPCPSHAEPVPGSACMQTGELPSAAPAPASKEPGDVVAHLMEMMSGAKGCTETRSAEAPDAIVLHAGGSSGPKAAAKTAAEGKSPSGRMGKQPMKCKARPKAATSKPQLGEQLPKFPGKPRAACPPLVYRTWKIYTDVNTSAWRCKQIGVRSDVSCSFKCDAQAAWKKVIATITKK